MFIELTDHLRCTADHDEAFLVLLPGRMAGRHVMAGTLGCPVCGREVEVVEGKVDFGGDPPAAGNTVLDAAAVVALLGLEGPGGYLALLGAATQLAEGLSTLMPGVSLVAINAPVDLAAIEAVSSIRAARHPLKQRSMRAVVVGADHAADPGWLAAALGSVLPGNRAVVEGGGALPETVTSIAEAAPVRVVKGR